MTTPTGQKRQGRVLLSTLLIAIVLDKFLVSRLLPQASGLVSINPMIVFLDIPVDLSLTFGLLSVTGIFILLYVLLVLPYYSRHKDPPHSASARQATGSRTWRIITGVLAIPCWVLSGGFLYLLAQPHLPKHARNAIESFGINADIATSFPGYELIHLRGSMVMLVCFFIGMYICLRKTRRGCFPPGSPPSACPLISRKPGRDRPVPAEHEHKYPEHKHEYAALSMNKGMSPAIAAQQPSPGNSRNLSQKHAPVSPRPDCG